MHLSSLANMKRFVEEYLYSKRDEKLSIVDLGSQEIGGSYRPFFACENWHYIGVDVVEGANVDVVLEDPYCWGEIKSATVDVIVSGQVFEHIEYFWLTAQEISRVLKPGGICCIIAPSGGPEHRYPVDCWRFYPDGFRALARYVGLDVLSVVTHWNAQGFSDDSARWADSVLVAQKPQIQVDTDDHIKAVPFVNSKEVTHIYEAIFDPESDDSLAKIAPQIAQESRVLELGSATGYFTEYMTKMLKCHVDCVELCQEMADRAKPFCQKMLVADLDKVALEDHFDIETYDYIVIADVLEHLVSPQKILKACRKLLKPQGELLLSVPNIAHAAVIGGLLRGEFNYTDEGLLDRTHVHFFTQKSLKDMLTAANFIVDQLDAVVRLPEQTEIGDDYLALPDVLQKALYDQSDSLAYQFIVTASPCDLTEYCHADLNLCSAAELTLRRNSYSQEMSDKKQELEEGLRRAEALLKERNEDFLWVTEKLSSLTAGFEHAEQLAFERLDQIKILDEALGVAENLAFERLEQIEILGKELRKAQDCICQGGAEKVKVIACLERINKSFFGGFIKKLMK